MVVADSLLSCMRPARATFSSVSAFGRPMDRSRARRASRDTVRRALPSSDSSSARLVRTPGTMRSVAFDVLMPSRSDGRHHDFPFAEVSDGVRPDLAQISEHRRCRFFAGRCEGRGASGRRWFVRGVFCPTKVDHDAYQTKRGTSAKVSYRTSAFRNRRCRVSAAMRMGPV